MNDKEVSMITNSQKGTPEIYKSLEDDLMLESYCIFK